MLSMARNFVKRLHEDEGGKMSVEMILLLALIALPLIVLLISFKDTIKSWFSAQQEKLEPDAG